MSRLLPLALAALALPATGHARDVFSERGGLFALSPGGVSVELNLYDQPKAAYQWGIDAGYYLSLGEHAGLAVTAYFEQNIEFFGDSGLLHRFRIGPSARLGWQNGNVFLFGMAGVGAGVFKLGAGLLGGGYDAGITMQTGLGSWFAIGDNFSLGVEVQFDADSTLVVGSTWGLSVSGRGLVAYHF
jgi:hypothetical protein